MESMLVRFGQQLRLFYRILLISAMQSDEIVEIIDLRSEPRVLENLIDNERYYPGWHMNKKHCYTIILDDSVPLEEICGRIDESYLLTEDK